MNGGKTKFGITEEEARRHGYQGDMKELSAEFAKSIYFNDYWMANNCQKISEIYEDLAYWLFDVGVNCGTGTAAKMLQTCLNLFNLNGKKFPDLVIDGGIGTKTIDAIQKVCANNDRGYLIKACEISRGARYIEICKANPTQEVFIRGWLNRTSLQFVPVLPR